MQINNLFSPDQSYLSSLSVYQSGWEQCFPSHGFGPAVRDHFLIHFVVAGTGIYCRGEQQYSLSRGDGFLILPDETTYYQADENDPWEYYWMGFNGSEALYLLQLCGLNKDHVTFHVENPDPLLPGLNQMVHLPQQGDLHSRECLQLGQLYLFLSHLMRENHSVQRDYSQTQSYCSQAIRYIRNNYSYDISIEQVAHTIGVSRSYLFKIFQKHLGTSPQAYLIDSRIQAAKRLLLTSSLPVGEIAASVGFKDIAHFSKLFKKQEGISPLSLRRTHPHSHEGESNYRQET